SVLREEFVKMIVKAFKLSVIGKKVPFLDVDENEWYREYIECAYNSGIISGYSDTEFGIGDSVSREDLAVMILRGIDICDYKLNNTSENIKLSDAEEISDYAKEAVEKLRAAGIINGDENGNFNPKQSATRAETAKILWMTIQNCEQ
ncbi:MAG: S-layer homology domain-containing protein, partial [Clostridiales bacterium]|nr:S-layer homology domain-containing protein [Clostridiales bacterium]